jgi:hypothetical protein
MRDRLLIAVSAIALVTAGALASVPSALADDPPGRTITLAGSLQSELGCPGD